MIELKEALISKSNINNTKFDFPKLKEQDIVRLRGFDEEYKVVVLNKNFIYETRIGSRPDAKDGIIISVSDTSDFESSLVLYEYDLKTGLYKSKLFPSQSRYDIMEVYRPKILNKSFYIDDVYDSVIFKKLKNNECQLMYKR